MTEDTDDSLQLDEGAKTTSRYRSTEPGASGALFGILVGLAFFGLIFGLERSRDNTTGTNNKPTREELETQKLLRRMLKDPAMTDRIIEQLKDTQAIQELLKDPEVIRNLRKLEEAILGHKTPSEQTMKRLREKKELLDDIDPRNWAEKAIQGNRGQSPKRTH
jgi:hypothetical protein